MHWQAAVQSTRKASVDRTGVQTSGGTLGSRHSLEGQVALHGWLMEAAEVASARPGQHQPPAAARRWLFHLPTRTATTSTQGMTSGRTTGHKKKKATPLTDADHVGLRRTACSMVSSVGSRWYY